MSKSIATLCFTVLTFTTMASGITTLPDFSQATFLPNQAVDNAYFPLTLGTLYRYEGDLIDPDTSESEHIKIEEVVTNETLQVYGVEVKVVRFKEWIDGTLIEIADDWYAQDTAGNVWYFGEFVVNFRYDDDDNLLGTDNDGSWVAGLRGALPGHIMPSNPPVGLNYYQEFAELDEAVDQATILSLDDAVSINLGDFTNVRSILEFTELELDVFEVKQFAPGIGLIRILEDSDEFGEDAENIIPLTFVGAVPEPLTGGSVLLGLAVLAVQCRRRRPQ